MQFWDVTPHGNKTKTYLFHKRYLHRGTSMLLTHQTFETSSQSQKYFSVLTETNIFEEVKLCSEWFKIRNLILHC